MYFNWKLMFLYHSDYCVSQMNVGFRIAEYTYGCQHSNETLPKPTLQTIQSTTSHGFLLSRCTTTFPHYPSSDSIKFTHPPTQIGTAGSISIWIATTFDVLVRYPWCSGCEKTQWLWDLKEKSAHVSSHTVRYPTSICDVQCISGVIL